MNRFEPTPAAPLPAEPIAHEPGPDEPGPAGPDDARRRLLRQNRILATGLLAGMGVILVLTHFVAEPGFLTALIRAGAEAGLVGGIADWFAVTALFRHPLGVPIPHTAIVPTNKDRIGRTIGRFVESNFLTPPVLVRKLREIEVGRRVAAWLAEPATAPLISRAVMTALPHLLRTLRSRDLHSFAQRAFGDGLTRLDVAPALANALRLMTDSGEADVLFDRLLEALMRWVVDNRGQLDTLISSHSRWWIPKAVDRHIAAAVLEGVAEILTRLGDPASEARTAFRSALRGMVTDLTEDPGRRAKVNDAARRLLAGRETRAWLASIGKELGDAAAADLAKPNPRLATAVERLVRVVAGTLAADIAMQRHIDDAAERAAHGLIGWRSEIGTFIAEVVGNWNTRTLVDRLELAVGSDLQYIRMNGTIVGAIVGCAIFLATYALS